MKLLKLFIFGLLTSSALTINANGLSGTVSISGKVPSGTLYIFARKFGSKMPMPLAVQRVENPKFPLEFSLDESNKMMESIPFKGPFIIVARISPSGSAMDKTGIEVKTTEPIELGAKDIKLNIIGKK